MAEVERPRDRMFAYVLDRLASLNVRATIECKEPTCGARDEEGEVVSCSSVHCGEKIMLSGWRRELQVMRDFQGLLEALERKEILEAATKERKR